MGLGTTHDAWSGAYSAFARWREAVGRAAGLPFRDGDLGPVLDIDWSVYTRENFHGMWSSMPVNPITGQPDPIMALLIHSDCGGFLPDIYVRDIRLRLEELLPALDEMGDGGGHIGQYGDKTRRFILGLRAAEDEGESVGFA